ncbi:MAG: DUF3365 domain-containing protein [Planctomycetota bacterium]
MLNRFRSARLSTKVITFMVTILIITVALNYTVFMTRYKASAEQSLVDEAAAFTAIAEETKDYAGHLVDDKSIDLVSLQADLEQRMEHGEDYKDSRFFNAIPVIVGWKSAAKAAEEEGLEFHVSAFDARNPDNEPEPDTFRHDLLTQLNRKVASGEGTSVFAIDESTNNLHYMRAIKLGRSCMMCTATG